jgi:hypothetical protein
LAFRHPLESGFAGRREWWRGLPAGGWGRKNRGARTGARDSGLGVRESGQGLRRVLLALAQPFSWIGLKGRPPKRGRRRIPPWPAFPPATPIARWLPQGADTLGRHSAGCPRAACSGRAPASGVRPEPSGLCSRLKRTLESSSYGRRQGPD